MYDHFSYPIKKTIEFMPPLKPIQITTISLKKNHECTYISSFLVAQNWAVCNPTQEFCICQQAAIQCKSCTCQLLQISTSFYEVGGVCNSTHKFNESPNSTKLHELEHRKIPVV
jgi:hypothetical protein